MDHDFSGDLKISREKVSPLTDDHDHDDYYLIWYRSKNQMMMVNEEGMFMIFLEVIIL